MTGLGTQAWKMGSHVTTVGCSSGEKAGAAALFVHPTPDPDASYRQHRGLDWFFPDARGPQYQNFGLVPPTPVCPWCRPNGLSITLRSASAFIDSLRLRSPSWTTAERRAACKVRRPRDEGWKAAAGWPEERARGKRAQRDGPGRSAEHWGALGSHQRAPPHFRSSHRLATHAQPQCSAFLAARLPPCARAARPCGSAAPRV